MKETAEDSSDIQRADFMASFLNRHKPPQESVDHFSSIEWTNKYMSDSMYSILPTFSRHLKLSGEDYFFSKTINTESTLPHMITLQLKDFKTVDDTSTRAPAQPPSSTKTISPAPEKPDALCLIQLGERGVDGHPSVIHGGVTCAILDEVMGLLVMLHYDNVQTHGSRDSLFTANLNVNYRNQISTPGMIVVKTWLAKRQGRKWYARAHIVDKEDRVLADAEGLWLIVKSTKL